MDAAVMSRKEKTPAFISAARAGNAQVPMILIGIMSLLRIAGFCVNG
jgi:hypothetical protein